MISSVINRVSYNGDGSSATFAFPYPFFGQSDLKVYLYNSSAQSQALQVINTNYTIGGTPNQQGVYVNGGSVICTSSIPSGLQVVIYRDGSLVQNYQLVQNGQINSVALVQQLDYVTLLCQRLQDQAGRSIQLAPGFSGTFDMTIPPIVMGGDRVLIMNSSATGFAIGPTASEIINANSSAIAAAASEAAAAASAAGAAASATAANSAAVSVGNNLILVNSAVAGVTMAASLIGSTAFWGATAQSAALSATNQAVLATSAAVSAGNLVVLANSAAVSAGNQAVLAASGALSASNSATAAAIAAGTVQNGVQVFTSGNNFISNSTAFIICHSSQMNIWLNDAPGVPGKMIEILRVHPPSSGGNMVTVKASSAQQIGRAEFYSANQVTMVTQGERLRLISDGTNWVINSWDKDTDWVKYTPSTVGFGTISADDIHWRRQNNDLLIRGRFFTGSSTANEARLSLPFAFTIFSGSSSIPAGKKLVGFVETSLSGATYFGPTILGSSGANHMTFGLRTDATQGLSPQVGNVIAANSTVISVIAQFPCYEFSNNF